MKTPFLSLCLSLTFAMPASAEELPDLPHPVVSFGAAAADGNVYVYGGQMEGAHQYHRDSQSGDLLRLRLTEPEKGWTKIADGKRVQGMAMVTYNGQLIRTGGLEARNAKGEEDDLVSTDEVVAWDIANEKWVEMPSLPIGQSSHDLALAGDRLYSVGGWMMHGKDGGEEWHDGGWVLDLTQIDAGWKPLPRMFEARRALATVATDTHVWAIGGMSGEGPSRSVERLAIEANHCDRRPCVGIDARPAKVQRGSDGGHGRLWLRRNRRPKRSRCHHHHGHRLAMGRRNQTVVKRHLVRSTKVLSRTGPCRRQSHDRRRHQHDVRPR